MRHRTSVRSLMFCLGCTLGSPVTALAPEDVDHLMQRVAFAAVPSDYSRFAALTREQAVERLLEEAQGDEGIGELPDWAQRPWSLAWWQHEPLHAPGTKPAPVYWFHARRWFLNGLLNAPSPLRARMALYWHEYFPLIRQKHAASAVRRDARFYELALGDYRDLLVAFSRDGTTMENLDMKQNRRGAINENFARELLELYTLGRGHYSQQDIRETARAFTGWAVHRRSGLFLVIWPWHDFGEKTVLGHTGHFDGDDVLELLFRHPRFAEHQVERLWRSFISPEPDARQVQAWATQFRNSDYSLAQLLRVMLGSDAFWSAGNRRALVKSPVELVVGALRADGVSGDHGAWMDLWATQMGQQLYLAPDVKGWRGHTDWLTVGTISTRQAFLSGMRHGFDPGLLTRLESASAYAAHYPLDQARSDSARVWRSIEALRSRGMTDHDAMTSANPLRNLK